MHCVIPTMRIVKVKFFILAILVLAVYLFLFYILIEVWFFKKITPIVITSVTLPYVVVHIDLKGSPPKLEYLESLLPMLKDHGVNGLLMEYEDMFPYEGKIANFSSRNCYNKAQLKTFLLSAVRSRLEIIPLVQTFGHLEHALKLKEFMHLREVPVYPDSICPSKVESRIMVKLMLEQVVNFHNGISPLKYIHVGCDEVFHINKCAQCENKGLSNVDLFIDYIRFLSDVVSDLSPDTTMLIWDDMLRNIGPMHWNKISGFNNIELVYWDYRARLDVSHIRLLNYHKKFKNIWTASAFKGADGKTATLPNLKHRVLNHFNWMKLMLDYQFAGENRIFHFRGIILTGWSRYSHMDPLCELLPVSIPSILINLLIIKRFKTGLIVGDKANTNLDEFLYKYVNAEFNGSLICDNGIHIDSFDSHCNFEGNELYQILEQYILINEDVEAGFYNDETDMSALEYYSKLKYINMNTLIQKITWCNDTLRNLQDVKNKLFNMMKLYYSNDVVDEYVSYKTYNLQKKLKNALEDLNKYTYTRVWERRPTITNVSVVF